MCEWQGRVEYPIKNLRRLVVIVAGAGGHAKEVLDILVQMYPVDDICFYDDVNLERDVLFGRYRILHSFHDIVSAQSSIFEFCVAVGSPPARKALFEKLRGYGGLAVSVVSLTAVVSATNTVIGEGVNAMHQCFVSADVRIGAGCLLNRGCGIHHDCQIGDFCEVGPGATLLGHVSLGNEILVGAGSMLLSGVEVGDGAVIGAGAVVTKTVLPRTVVVGVPARDINAQ